MDRTLISWNVPNLVTVALMAFIGFLVLGTVYQVAMKAATGSGGSNNTANTAGGF